VENLSDSIDNNGLRKATKRLPEVVKKLAQNGKWIRGYYQVVSQVATS